MRSQAAGRHRPQTDHVKTPCVRAQDSDRSIYTGRDDQSKTLSRRLKSTYRGWTVMTGSCSKACQVEFKCSRS